MYKRQIQQRHALSFSGIKNGVNYYTALGILDQGSLFKEGHNDKYTRYNLRSNVSTTFDPIGLEVGLNIDGAWERKHPTIKGAYAVWRDINAPNQLSTLIIRMGHLVLYHCIRWLILINAQATIIMTINMQMSRCMPIGLYRL